MNGREFKYWNVNDKLILIYVAQIRLIGICRKLFFILFI